MKLKIIIILLVSSLLGTEIDARTNPIVFTDNSDQLSKNNARAIFLDPHNHIGGILPPLALVDLEKFIKYSSPTIEQLYSFWQALMNKFNDSPQVKDNNRMSNMAKMVMTCNQPESICAKGLNDACKISLRKNIANLLTSSPVTTFWTAYKFRELANAGYVYEGLEDEKLDQQKSLFAKANLLELARKNVGVVEMSVNFAGGVKGPSSTKLFDVYRNLTDDINSENTSAENLDLKETLSSKGLPTPEIKWLLMTHTMELGRMPGDKTLTYQNNGVCEEITMPEAIVTDPVKGGLVDIMAKTKDVVGVDVAGAEFTCFTKDGMDSFKDLAKAVYRAAQERQHYFKDKSRLVVRAHVGEGAPYLEVPLLNDKEEACEAIKTFPKLKFILDQDGKYRPIHVSQAIKNIAYMLNAIEELKKEIPDINDFVIFRLAHLTHITKPLAFKAKRLGIYADVNLSSNVSTGATVINESVIKKYFTDKNINADETDGLINTLLKNGAAVEEFLGNHGLKWLLYYHIPTILGSDGSGLENSASMNQEYFLARKLIKYWNDTDANFKNHNVSLNDLLKAQQSYFNAMGIDK